MSGLIDTNLLVYAVNRDSPQNQSARSFLSETLEGTKEVYLCWAVFYEFLRVTTHPKVFPKPLTWQEALGFVAGILKSPNVKILYEGEGHCEVLQDVLRLLRIPQGNLMHDAHIAALLKENGLSKIYTCDTDLRLFPFLEVVDPISE